MNVSLQKLFLDLLFILAVPLLGWSEPVSLTTYRDQPVDYIFSSFPYGPSIINSFRPENGTVEITDLGDNNYKLTYQPEAGFVGDDATRIFVWVGTNFEPRDIIFKILPSKVQALPDFTYTYQGLPVDVDVLVNDEGSSTALSLKSVLLVNNGTATINGGGDAITFTPGPDYSGVTQLNYVVCDDYGICDQGTVTVNVLPSSGTAQADTIRVFTKRNQSQVVFVPRDFAITDEPDNGTFDPAPDLPTYTPAPDFVGKDYLQFSDGVSIRTVEINVLDVANNTFAFDDDVYASSYQAVEFNVLENDFHGKSSGCLTFTQPEFGTVEEVPLPNGTFNYIPPAGFKGIDKFTYSIRPPECDGEVETATVYVYVSDFEPAYSKFKMVTPKRTPLIIGYNVPIRNFDFEISDQAEMGEARFLEGRVDTMIYGQRIRGFNIILYTPDEAVDSGTDEFEIEYCLIKSGQCQYKKIVKIEVDILDIGDGEEPMCFDDCIWAGDTNFDGIVNIQDLMPLGRFLGNVGTPRTDANLELWYGQYGDDWGAPAGVGLADLKHLDTDGDSLITALDTAAISQFYGKTHSLAPAVVPNFRHIVELHGDVFVEPGEEVVLDMVLGSSSDPAVDVYGFTFPLEYNTDFFRPESVRVKYEDNSWIGYGSPVLSMSNNDNNGLLESGYTRTNRLPVSGFGKFGEVRLIIQDDIAGFRPDDEEITVDIGGGAATMVNAAGQSFGVQIEKVTIHILLNGKEEEYAEDPQLSARQLQVFPNPTRDVLNVRFANGQEFQRILVFNVAGQQVLDSGTLATWDEQLDVSQLSNGMYFMKVQTGDSVLHKKFEIMR